MPVPKERGRRDVASSREEEMPGVWSADLRTAREEGYVALRGKRFQDALGLFEGGLSRFHNDTRLTLGKGHALKHLGRHDEAIKAYRKAVNLATGNFRDGFEEVMRGSADLRVMEDERVDQIIEAVSNIGDIYLYNLRNPGMAVEHYVVASGIFETHGGRATGRELEMYLRMGKACSQIGDDGRAKGAWETLISTAEGMTAGERNYGAMTGAHLGLATIYAKEGDGDKAVEHAMHCTGSGNPNTAGRAQEIVDRFQSR